MAHDTEGASSRRDGIFVRKLPSGRWQANYNSAGPGLPWKSESTGTWGTRAQAEKAARAKRERIVAGLTLGHNFDARTTVGEYWDYFIDIHAVLPGTRADYNSAYNVRIKPSWERVRLGDANVPGCTVWVERLKLKPEENSPRAINKAIAAFSAMFKKAVQEGIRPDNPMSAIDQLPTPRQKISIISPRHYEIIMQKLALPTRQLFLEVEIATGMRLGEMFALAPRQLNRLTNRLTVDRALTTPGKGWSTSGDRFEIKLYPKNRKLRFFKIDPLLMKALWALIDAQGLGPNDIIFNRNAMGVRRPGPRHTVPDLDLTDPALAAMEPFIIGRRTYRHGTLNGYRMCTAGTEGKRRCDWCRAAQAQRRRAAKGDAPRLSPQIVDRSPEMNVCPPDIWRDIFYDAVEAADLGFLRGELHAYHMRHATISWLTRLSGVDVFTAMDQVGHGDLTVTRYYAPVEEDNLDDTVASAMSRLVGRR